jgi:hypothetical protein
MDSFEEHLRSMRAVAALLGAHYEYDYNNETHPPQKLKKKRPRPAPAPMRQGVAWFSTTLTGDGRPPLEMQVRVEAMGLSDSTGRGGKVLAGDRIRALYDEYAPVYFAGYDKPTKHGMRVTFVPPGPGSEGDFLWPGPDCRFTTTTNNSAPVEEEKKQQDVALPPLCPLSYITPPPPGPAQ